MDSIPKFLVSIITIIVGILFCISFIISSVVVDSARTYHASIIEELENSDFEEITIQKCLDAAEEDNYSLSIETVSGAVNASQTMYKVTLSYGLNAPIFTQKHTGTIVGYALSGTHMVEPVIEMPENPETGDVFKYNEYEYRYNMYYFSGDTWLEDETQNGWGARVLDDTKTEYNRPLSMIGDTPVVSLSGAYADCANLLQAPTIPSTVVDMTHAFTGCVSLKTASAIPSSVKRLNSTYYGCTSLVNLPDLSNASSLQEMSGTFVGCVSLPTDLSGYVIPSTVTTGYKMFLDCTQLITAPVIPSNLTDIRSIFENCISLTGTVYVHSNPNAGYFDNAFQNTVQPIIIGGTCSIETKTNLATTSTNGNVSVS